MIEHSPLVSILMPAYNAEKFIKESIESVLSQTYIDFELIVLNDGSSDNSVAIVEGLKDNRIKLFHNEKNMGLSYTRNRLLSLAKGEYIAILDSDDLALSQRLERQVGFLEKNKEYFLHATSSKVINENGRYRTKWQYKENSEHINTHLFFENPITHSSIMFRNTKETDIFFYKEEAAPAEDYDFYLRIIRSGRKIFITDEILCVYRYIKKSTSRSQIGVSKSGTALKRIWKDELFLLGIDANKEQMELHHSIFTNNYIPSNDFPKDILSWTDLLLEQNQNLKVFDEQDFKKHLAKKVFLSLLLAGKQKRINCYKIWDNSIYKNFYSLSWKESLKLYWRSLL